MQPLRDHQDARSSASYMATGYVARRGEVKSRHSTWWTCCCKMSKSPESNKYVLIPKVSAAKDPKTPSPKPCEFSTPYTLNPKPLNPINPKPCLHHVL